MLGVTWRAAVDYDWHRSLAAVIAHCVPLVLTSNTPEELLAELALLSDFDAPHGSLFALLLPPLVNPFMSRQRLQSGTLANDVYFKNTALMVLHPEERPETHDKRKRNQ